jgi:hypothetical protein
LFPRRSSSITRLALVLFITYLVVGLVCYHSTLMSTLVGRTTSCANKFQRKVTSRLTVYRLTNFSRDKLHQSQISSDFLIQCFTFISTSRMSVQKIRKSSGVRRSANFICKTFEEQIWMRCGPFYHISVCTISQRSCVLTFPLVSVL